MKEINCFLRYEFPKYQLIQLNSDEWNNHPSNIVFNYLTVDEFEKRGNDLFEQLGVKYGVTTDNHLAQIEPIQPLTTNIYPLETNHQIDYYEKLYQQATLSTAQIKQELVDHLFLAKDKVSKKISESQIKLNLIKQNIKISEKNREYLNNQKEYMEEIEIKEKKALTAISHQIILQEKEIDCLLKEIERIFNELSMKKQQSKQIDVSTSLITPLIDEATNLQTELDKNTTVLKAKQLNREFLIQKKQALEHILLEEGTGLQNEISYISERINYFHEELVNYRIEKSTMLEELAKLTRQIKKIDNRLIELGKSPYALLEHSLFNQAYFFGFSDLSMKLTKERSKAITMCNYVNQKEHCVGILTTHFNPEIDAIINQYKFRGWLQRDISHHNLYQDLLQLNQMGEINRQVISTDLPNVELVELKDNSGKLIMKSFFKKGKLFKKDCYNSEGECVLNYQFTNEKLTAISYKGESFNNEQELISYWINHYVAPGKTARVVLHQQTPLLQDQLAFNESGIRLIPLIYNATNLDQLMVNQSIDELFLAEGSDLEDISKQLTREVFIRRPMKLADKEVEEPLKTRIMIGE